MTKPQTGKQPLVKMTIYLTDTTRRALRIRAIQEGVSATKVVEGLIEEYLRKRGGDR